MHSCSRLFAKGWLAAALWMCAAKLLPVSPLYEGKQLRPLSPLWTKTSQSLQRLHRLLLCVVAIYSVRGFLVSLGVGVAQLAIGETNGARPLCSALHFLWRSSQEAPLEGQGPNLERTHNDAHTQPSQATSAGPWLGKPARGPSGSFPVPFVGSQQHTPANSTPTPYHTNALPWRPHTWHTSHGARCTLGCAAEASFFSASTKKGRPWVSRCEGLPPNFPR